jgi:hypothetical protein
MGKQTPKSFTIKSRIAPSCISSQARKLQILHHKAFRDRLVLVTIDDLHIVEQWGENFRKQYSQLQVLRARVGTHVPWFGTSGILDPAMLESVKRSVGFDPDVRVIHADIFFNLHVAPFHIENRIDVKGKCTTGPFQIYSGLVKDNKYPSDRPADLPNIYGASAPRSGNGGR